jgi:hypothetical protein
MHKRLGIEHGNFCVGLDILSGLLLGWINTHLSISKCEPRLSVDVSAHVSYGLGDLFARTCLF